MGPLSTTTEDHESPSRLKTMTGPHTYLCQATQLPRATTKDLPWWEFRQYIVDVRSHTFSPLGALMVLLHLVLQRLEWMVVRLRQVRRRSAFARLKHTGLRLAPGELVEVNKLADILSTLDEKGTNRGLSFQVDMLPACGTRFHVEARVERLIDESTGKMREVKDTVYLRGGLCDRHRGCGRNMYHLWREAWLHRVNDVDR